MKKDRTGRQGTALLIIDVINDLDFSEGEALLKSALPMAHRIRDLKQRALEAEVPVIYVNDNFGRWQSNLQAQVEYCERPESRGRELVQLLRPGPKDFFVLKPKFSGFFGTTLELLLEHLGCGTVILTGVATNLCVLFTANDAYLRDYEVIVPRDCSAANTPQLHATAIEQMALTVKAFTCDSTEIDFDRLRS